MAQSNQTWNFSKKMAVAKRNARTGLYLLGSDQSRFQSVKCENHLAKCHLSFRIKLLTLFNSEPRQGLPKLDLSVVWTLKSELK